MTSKKISPEIGEVVMRGTGRLFVGDYHIPTKSLYDLEALILRMVVLYNYNLLIVGERGTGKELFAQSCKKNIKEQQNWKDLNCAAFSDTLLLSELFGHKKGAYTGADSQVEGFLGELKEDSGLFLDELGASSQQFQTALLRVMETGDFSPVGSQEIKKLPSKVCILAATSGTKNIRDDLYDRFKKVYIPPLRERNKDIPFLVKYFCKNIDDMQQKDRRIGKIKRVKYISELSLSLLQEYQWPGNIRELRNLIEIAFFLAQQNSEDTMRAFCFPSLTTTNQVDQSSKKKISAFHDKARPIPMNDFLTPWSELKPDVKLEPRNPDHNCLISTLSKIHPNEYKDEFWRYYGRLGLKAKEMVAKFPNFISESRTRQLLNEARKK